MRVVLYSHDTMGLGHLRRNLAIAEALVTSSPHATVLLVAGAREAGAFTLPPRSEYLVLPAFSKDVNGEYGSRGLELSLGSLVSLRAETIRAALAEFSPDVMIVDKMPCGAFRELKPALRLLRSRGRTRCILGLRDVLDHPKAVAREWKLAGAEEEIEEFYDAVWVYGDPAVYDPVHEYRVASPVADRTTYTGYLARSGGSSSEGIREVLVKTGLTFERVVLCLVGGGQDGAALAESFALADMPPDAAGVLVMGPFMPEDQQVHLRALAARNPRLRVFGLVRDLEAWIRQVDRVVTMGGYNSVCEVLAARKPMLIVPRVRPRQEQEIRARRLQELGVAEVLHPEDLAPDLLSDWLSADPAFDPAVCDKIDVGGLARLAELLGAAANPALRGSRPRGASS